MERVGRLAFAVVLLLPVIIVTFIVYSLSPEADDPLQDGPSQDSSFPATSSEISLPNHVRSFSNINAGQHRVGDYVRADGVHVHGYVATNPNGNRSDNLSSKGNINPYTGQHGHR